MTFNSSRPSYYPAAWESHLSSNGYKAKNARFGLDRLFWALQTFIGEFSGAALSPATSNIIIKNEVLLDCSFKSKSANIFFFFFFFAVSVALS